MNKRDFAKKKLSEWTDRLDLNDWAIKLRLYRRLALDEQYCLWSKSEKVARIGINVEAQSESEIEHSVVHELLHLVLASEYRVFDNLNETCIPPKQQKAWDEQYNLACNESIEHMARLIYKMHEMEYPPHK
jgi:Zn-dependent peptidase ImmA (M78 family)